MKKNMKKNMKKKNMKMKNMKMKNMKMSTAVISVFLISLVCVSGLSAEKIRRARVKAVDIESAAGQLNEASRKQLDYFIQIARQMDTLNRIDFLKPYNSRLTGRISKLLNDAAAVETDPCARQYLSALSHRVTTDEFYTRAPRWVSLENNLLEVVFLPDRRRKVQEMLFTQFLPIDTFRFSFRHVDPSHRLEQVEARGYNKTGTGIIDTFVYINDPEETFKYEQYTRRYSVIRDSLPYKKKLKVPYPGRPPKIKIARLLYASGVGGSGIVYPGPGAFYNFEDRDFKIVIFKNLLETYVECILAPIYHRVILPSPLTPPVDAEAYLSQAVMNKIARHMGPMFEIKIKGTTPIRGAKDDEDRQLQEQLRRERLMKQPGKKKRELRLMMAEMEDRFPQAEELKTRAIALHNTDVLRYEGLIQADDAAAIYTAYVVSLVDRLRRDPRHPLYKAHVVQFNYLLRNGALVFNINNNTLSLQPDQFPIVAKTLAETVLDKFNRLNRLFSQYGKKGPELETIVEKIKNVPRTLKPHFHRGH
jgi:hypothetical protein